MNDSSPSSPKVSIEDLIRLKRAERPPADFWVEFERELRVKQLAAIVERAPWWRIQARSFGRLSKFGLSLGAGAALALTLVTLREHRLDTRAADFEGTQQLSTSANASAFSGEASSGSRTLDGVSGASEPGLATLEPAAATVEVREMPAPTASQPEISAGSIDHSYTKLVTGIEPSDSANRSPTPSERSISANRTAYEGTGHELATLLEPTNGFEVRSGIEPGASVEPLTQVASPREMRRSRLLAFVDVKQSSTAHDADNVDVLRSRERATRRLNDEGLADSISRLGLNGDRFSIKF